MSYLTVSDDRLQCGHLFCYECLVELFGNAREEALCFQCPDCDRHISTPPQSDAKVASAVFWLLLLLGDQPTDEPKPVPTNVFDVYFEG